MIGFIEKRRYERVVYGTKVDVKTDTDRFQCTAINISLGGILIKTGKPLSLGQTISICLPLFESEDAIIAEGTVVRKAQDCYGIHFSSPLEALPS
jgi:hypothetical protein